MFKGISFADLQILETLDVTHEGQTKVYLAKLNQQIVVCKAIQKIFFKDAKTIEHVKNQKQALIHFTNLKHPSINHLLTTFQDSQKIYILLEVIEGLPLHKLLKMMGRFNQELTFIILKQVAQIMKDIHSQGFIYRDIKASNFIINAEGKITIIDFGQAKRIQRQKAYTICGTTHAMPPEIYKKAGYSFQFDCYSFGILAYQLSVGTAPFGYGNTNQNILSDIMKGINQQILSKIQDQKLLNLISKLICPEEHRLGKIQGFKQILLHPYFQNKQTYSLDQKYISQIKDFGIDKNKYQQIPIDDPFYKFFG